MQDTQTAIPHWAFELLRTALTLGIGGGLLRIYELWQNRKKPVVEVKKTEAEATEITIRSHSTAGESMIRMMDRLETALNTNDRLRGERDTANADRDNAQFENRQLTVEIAKRDDQIKMDAHYIKRLQAAIELGVTLDQLDKVKPPSKEGQSDDTR